ncbi:zinc-finger domain-containing protein [Candidatus Puniceispirillum marinum]|jgi:uncharacterized Zn-finger protein|uniref:Zinc finger CHCC-type domain-containing protein n=1 Tax=Puniceispirillum marinum (strain IMCC1322) TaxID=488538 RepID=D5BTB5_PUNMI|nr:hypothetical protein SAR116_1269 [Candidatus Puniceispirillum marinum IMCC1322]
MSNQENMSEATAEDMAVIPTSQHRVSCNGGGGALGHPLVWLTLGTDDKVVCPYCSRTFVKSTSDNS